MKFHLIKSIILEDYCFHASKVCHVPYFFTKPLLVDLWELTILHKLDSVAQLPYIDVQLSNYFPVPAAVTRSTC